MIKWVSGWSKFLEIEIMATNCCLMYLSLLWRSLEERVGFVRSNLPLYPLPVLRLSTALLSSFSLRIRVCSGFPICKTAFYPQYYSTYLPKPPEKPLSPQSCPEFMSRIEIMLRMVGYLTGLYQAKFLPSAWLDPSSFVSALFLIFYFYFSPCFRTTIICGVWTSWWNVTGQTPVPAASSSRFLSMSCTIEIPFA